LKSLIILLYYKIQKAQKKLDGLYHFENDTLDKFIGDIIIKQYIKEDPKVQSVWNTDVSRLAYLVRELINNKKEWSIDKGGNKVTEYIIKPILDFIKIEIEKYK
jgi:hypothetical protein